MTPLREDEARAWLAKTRARLTVFPDRVDGPYGAPVAAAYVQDERGPYVTLTGFVEGEDRQMRPLEVEFAPGVSVPLDLLRITYDPPPRAG